MTIDRRQLLRRSSKWAVVGFTLKGTCTLSIMLWTAFTAWSGKSLSGEGLLWHGVAVSAVTLGIGAVCVTRFVRRRQHRPVTATIRAPH